MYYCAFEGNLAVNVQSTLSSSPFLFSSSVRIHGKRSFKSGTISRRVAAIILICLEFVPLHFHCPRLPSSHRPREFFRARHPSSPSSALFFNRYTALPCSYFTSECSFSTRLDLFAKLTAPTNRIIVFPLELSDLRSIYHRTFAYHERK